MVFLLAYLINGSKINYSITKLISIEMTESNSLRRNVVQFNGTWFKLDDFALRHPGGKSFVRIFEGRDVTHAFRSYHPHLSDHHFHTKLQKKKGNGLDTNAKDEAIVT